MLAWLLASAETSWEQLEEGAESLFMSHCVLVVVLSERSVLGVMIHEISQTLAFFYIKKNLNFFFTFFPVLLQNNHIPTPFLCMFMGTAYPRTETQFKQLRMLG